jgi:hypothetical protein
MKAYMNLARYDVLATSVGLILRGLPLVLVCLMVACATPGPADYAAAAADYRREAQMHEGLAREQGAAMRVLQTRGDSAGAEIARQAMDEEQRSAQRARLGAEKDSWLSQF